MGFWTSIFGKTPTDKDLDEMDEAFKVDLKELCRKLEDLKNSPNTWEGNYPEFAARILPVKKLRDSINKRLQEKGFSGLPWPDPRYMFPKEGEVDPDIGRGHG